jgi:hypothetical protein
VSGAVLHKVSDRHKEQDMKRKMQQNFKLCTTKCKRLIDIDFGLEEEACERVELAQV